MSSTSLTNEELVVTALLKTPEMKKHISQEELAEYESIQDLLYYSKNPYVKALAVLVKGTTDGKKDQLIYDELLFNLKGLEG